MVGFIEGIVACDGGTVVVDELDKQPTTLTVPLYEAMETQKITYDIHKKHLTLMARVNVSALMNPVGDRFSKDIPLVMQIPDKFRQALLSRFDVIFILRDLPNRAQDEAIATHVLLEHQKSEASMPVEKELFRKFVAYAKQKIIPMLTDEAIDEIKRFYVNLRNTPVALEQPTRPLPISARQLEALVRLAEASARCRLSNKVTKKDAKMAIELMKNYLMQVGYDYETKSFDIDKITTGISTSERNKIIVVRETIIRLETRMGKLIPIEELEKELEGKLTKVEIEEAINKLNASGDIFKPRRGYIQAM